MTIQKVGKDDREQFTLQTNPKRTFSSSSLSGISGTVKLFARRSDIEKEVQPLSAFSDSLFNDHDLQQVLDVARKVGTTDRSVEMQKYLEAVNDQSISARKQKELEIIRFEPSFTLTSDTLRKNAVRTNFFPYYRSIYPTAHWAYTNYHTLNFFTSSTVPEDTVLLYPSSASITATGQGSGSYALSDAFTFEFYINPRYTVDKPGDSFKAGTLFHLSSSYAISLITGSSVDETDKPDGYRLVLQLHDGTDTAPSVVVPTSNFAHEPISNVFISNDNILRRNRWQRVGIRWSQSINGGTGSFIVEGKEAGAFVFNSGSVMSNSTLISNPDVLCIGNYYEGVNTGSTAQSRFFNLNVSEREGLTLLNNDGTTAVVPDAFTFAHPLNAEVHELKIHNRYLHTQELSGGLVRGTASTGSLIFYVPPFFTKESPIRKTVGADDGIQGGVPQTPFFAISGSTDDPFNVAYSFGVGGHLLNLENFTRDFVTSNYPRLLHLSSTQIENTTPEAKTANEFLYSTGSVRKRNLTILPNDNGNFIPNYSLLESGPRTIYPESGTALDRYVNDLGNLDFSLIKLTELISDDALFPGLIFDSGSFFSGLAGATPEDPGVAPGSVLTIFQRTRDNSSNEVVFFDISNMFYGNQIDPGSFVVIDDAITGSGGKVKITLRDDGCGNLYRGDAVTPHPTWASVGNILYNEGIVVIKSPNIPLFGRDQFEMSFAGEQNIHIMRVNVLARAGEINSSSNPTYIPGLSASNNANDTDSEFVYLTGLNFHDDNLNVVMKTRFSQPIVKRSGDRLFFKIKMDF